MKRGRHRARSLLARLQLGLEALYRVETRLAIDAFLIDDDQRDRIAPARAPREQLLLREEDGELAMALFVDAAERERYRTANQQASRYAEALERRFVTREQTGALLAEVRRFYRMDLPDKLGRIAQLA